MSDRARMVSAYGSNPSGRVRLGHYEKAEFALPLYYTWNPICLDGNIHWKEASESNFHYRILTLREPPLHI